MDNAKILFVCPNVYIGGFSSYALNLSRAFRRLGVRTGSIVVDPYGSLAMEFVNSFDDVIFRARKLERRENYVRRLLSTISQWSPDCIIVNAVPAAQATFRHLDRKVVRISVVHSVGRQEVALGTADPDFIDAVIAVAENVHDRIRELRDHCPVQAIPVGVEIFPNELTAFKGGTIRLAHVGRLSPLAKNLETIPLILDALAGMGVPFTMSFVGDGEMRRVLEKRFAHCGYARAVRFLGILPPDGVRAALSDSHVLLLTSVSEGTPHAVLEAMERGMVPVVSRIAGATDRVISHERNGFLCEPSSAPEFADCVACLHNQPEVFTRMSQAARQTVIYHFGVDMIAERYLKLIGNLGSRRRSMPASTVQNTSCVFDAELMAGCASFPRHCRRLAGDAYRRIAFGIKRVKH